MGPPQGISIQTPEQQQCLYKLLGFVFDIAYKLGAENAVADAFSRKPEDTCMMFSNLSCPSFHIVDQLQVQS